MRTPDRWTATRRCASGLLAAAAVLACAPALAQERTVYRCPGNVYTDGLTAKEAAAKGCKTLEGAPVTVIQSTVPRRSESGAAARSGGEGAKVDPADQRARDADKRRILEDELRREEERLASLQKEYNNGEPERRGDERNYQKYLDRVADLKASIERSQADIAALRREIGKLPGGGG
ncbi:hypothetical protein [Caldimonas sp. KR1-144]|uniref:hypothetical protein n=1 Tax=Caldimonas sp. KR1-144 TaxID=3400911 RepID=UPI003BFDCB72